VHFLRRFGEEFGKSFQGFTEPAMRRLIEAPWPGNVRELKNTIERAALLSNDPLVRPEHLSVGWGPGRGLEPAGADDESAGAGGDLVLLPRGERSLRAAEEALIRRVLAETGGNRSRSARALGINRTTLYHKLRTYGIEEDPA
jgi:DNA-binding NtrC family response regulator